MADYDIVEAFAKIEKELMESMVRNLDHHRAMEIDEGFEWSQWQVEQLKALENYKKKNRKKYGTEFKDIEKEIASLIYMARQQGKMDQEIKILEAIKKGFTDYHKPLKREVTTNAAFFRTNDRKIDALIEATTNDFKKAEYAMLRRADDQYRKVIFDAQMYAIAGGTTYEKAVDMAMEDFIKAGIQCVEYSNGARHTMKDYADMCIKTAVKRAYLTGEGEKRKEWGISLVIMNKRGKPCPKCLPFAGKILVDDVWSGGKPDGKHMLMSKAIEKGLYHPRCRDSHTTYFEGITTTEGKPYTKEEKEEILKDYNKEQKANYCKRQAEQQERLGTWLLDGGSRKIHMARAKQWEKLFKEYSDTENESGNLSLQRIGDNNVDLNKLNSAEFSKKFNRITNNSKVNDAIRKYARAMLTHRNGTDGEDLYIIDILEGEKKFSETKGKNILGVELKREEIEMIREMPNVIGIHNHPTNILPTGSDFVTAGYRRYEFGIMVTHDLRVFQYKVGNKPFTSEYFDKKVDKYMGVPYNLSIEEAQIKVLDELVEECGIQWMEL